MSSNGGVLKRIKRGALGAAKTAGAFRVIGGSRWRHQRLTILCYHGVSLLDEHEWNSSYYMSPSAFADRMRMLRASGCSVVPLGEGLRRLREGTLPPASVAVTFDDGMHDFFARAQPVLEEFGIPATVYLTTYYSDFNRPVFGVCVQYMLWRGRAKSLDLSPLVPGAPTYDLSSETARRDAHRRMVEFTHAAESSAQEKDDLARRLAGLVGVDYDELLARRVLHVMNNDEVRELARRGVDFQLHTHRHRTPMDRALFLREIDDNRKRLRELAGTDARHFCYPSGIHRPAFLPWLEEAGVESATTCIAGLASAHSEPLLLPRIVDGHHLSPIEFEGWLCGASAFLPRRA